MIKEVNVTPRLIQRGDRGSSCSCPIALAGKVLVKDNVIVSVSRKVISFRNAGVLCAHVQELPIKAKFFVVRFDKGRNPQPIKFELNIPQEFLK